MYDLVFASDSLLHMLPYEIQKMKSQKAVLEKEGIKLTI